MASPATDAGVPSEVSSLGWEAALARRPGAANAIYETRSGTGKESAENGRRPIFAQKAEGPQQRSTLGVKVVTRGPLIVLFSRQEEPEALFPAMSGIVGKLEVIAGIVNRGRRIGDCRQNSIRHGICLGSEIRLRLKSKADGRRKFDAETPARNFTTCEQKVLELTGTGLDQQSRRLSLIESFQGVDDI
jgi:hypothetical protein